MCTVLKAVELPTVRYSGGTHRPPTQRHPRLPLPGPPVRLGDPPCRWQRQRWVLGQYRVCVRLHGWPARVLAPHCVRASWVFGVGNVSTAGLLYRKPKVGKVGKVGIRCFPRSKKVGKVGKAYKASDFRPRLRPGDGAWISSDPALIRGRRDASPGGEVATATPATIATDSRGNGGKAGSVATVATVAVASLNAPNPAILAIIICWQHWQD